VLEVKTMSILKQLRKLNDLKLLTKWFAIVSGILIFVGLIFAFFGFGFFPDAILPKQSLLRWESSIYGSIMIGWGSTLFLLGRIAFKRSDIELMKIMIAGIAIWLIIEALFSAVIGIYFNVGVDIIVLLLFGIPLLKSISLLKR
jgi:heme/copper-type cytochrome/quinol oxidase subunit 3